MIDHLRRLLADHQRSEPHHADQCALCRETQAAIDGAPVAAQEPTPTDRYVDSLHRAVERLTAALHVATLRTHPHMTHAEIQAEIVRIARTPAPAAADGAQGERQIPYAVALTAIERLRGNAATTIEDHEKDGYDYNSQTLPQHVAWAWAKEIHGIDAKAFLDEAIQDEAEKNV